MSLWVRRWTFVKAILLVSILGVLAFITKNYTDGFYIYRPFSSSRQHSQPVLPPSNTLAPLSPADYLVSRNLEYDGVLHYQRQRKAGPDPTLLWLTLTRNLESWGEHRGLIWTKDRSFNDYLHLVISQVDLNTTSIALLTSSRDEFDLYKSAFQHYDFACVNLFLHPGYEDLSDIDRDNRHNQDKTIQTRRRAELSKLRNFLMLKSLGREKHIVWLDADIYYLDPGIVKHMIKHGDSDGDVGIITARCTGNGIDDYDRNAWRGIRTGEKHCEFPYTEDLTGNFGMDNQLHVAELYKGTKDDELIELTTVGATFLYIRASLVWQGLSFPHQYVIGTKWGKDGCDGIESEGLCYRARGLVGGKCAFVGGHWHTKHTKDTTD